jgi:S1-C subfamily serine protease
VAQDSLSEELGIDRGALIIKVVPDSGPERAELRRTRRDSQGNIQLGDVIVAVDGKTVDTSDDLFTAL